jgi:hypothetical protein
MRCRCFAREAHTGRLARSLECEMPNTEYLNAECLPLAMAWRGGDGEDRLALASAIGAFGPVGL